MGGGISHNLSRHTKYPPNLIPSQTLHQNLPPKSLLSKFYILLQISKYRLFSKILPNSPKLMLVLGIVFNLMLLGYFKYTDFIITILNAIFHARNMGLELPLPHILLPLALSFVTFQQIAFLCDCYNGCLEATHNRNIQGTSPIAESKNFHKGIASSPNIAESNKESITESNTESIAESNTESNKDSAIGINFLDYCLFITFFPQLIAGPIVHHKEMMPQFSTQMNVAFVKYENIAKGLFIFLIGLFKKVIIADSFALWANAGFGATKNGEILNFFESWATSLSYTFQLYFDFSGYCDMAIGLGLLFGIVLPINFNSPYKARNITDFWRLWHITLGRFLRDYLYIPLGGNKVGIKEDFKIDKVPIVAQSSIAKSRKLLGFLRKIANFDTAKLQNKIFTLRNLFIVAFVSGLWHGAGFGFIIWGILHGIAMCVHRIYMWWVEALKANLCDSKPCLMRLDSCFLSRLFLVCLNSPIYAVFCWFITFNFINIAWIFFRAENLTSALNLIKGMFAFHIILPKALESKLSFLGFYDIAFGPWLSKVAPHNSMTMLVYLAFGFVLIWGKNAMKWNLNGKIMVFAGAMFAFLLWQICSSTTPPEFIYFNF